MHELVNDIIVQHCRACGQTKLAEEFPKNRMNKDGLHSYCKPCQNAKCAQYQRNSLAAKQEGRPVTETPADVVLPEEAFANQKVKCCMHSCMYCTCSGSMSWTEICHAGA